MDKGRVGGVHPPVSPVWQPRRSCWLVSSAFLAETREWAGLHRPSQGKDLSGSWKERAPGSWAGVPGLAFLGGTVPQELRAPFQRPDLDGFNSRAFLRKCLSWQQLQPTRARLWLTSPARAGGEGAERGRAGWGLAGSQAIPRC